MATFVGKPKMSLVDGWLELAADGVDFVVAGPPDRARFAAARIGLREGTWTDVALGVRAEDVRIGTNGTAPGIPARSFEATVQLLEPIGSDTFVELAAGDATDRRARCAGRRSRTRPDRPAELVAGRIHLFEREQGSESFNERLPGRRSIRATSSTSRSWSCRLQSSAGSRRAPMMSSR